MGRNTKETMSRRDFLKISSLVAAAGLKLTLENASLVSGLFSQDSLLTRSMFINRVLLTCPPEVSAAYLKLNTAEIVAAFAGLPLTSKTIGHFLRGNGHPLNATRPIENIIRTSYLNPDRFLDAAVQKQIPPAISRLQTGRTLQLTSTFVTSFPGNRDLTWSINHATIQASGPVIDLSPGHAIVHQPQVTLTDKYDWDKQPLTVSTINPEKILTTILSIAGSDHPSQTLRRLFPDGINKPDISVTTHDGYLVQSFPTGAKPYDIFTSPISTSADHSLPLSS